MQNIVHGKMLHNPKKKKTSQHREGSAKGQRAGLYLCRACFYKFAQTGLIGATLVQF